MISLSNLTKSFGNFDAVKSISLAVPEGAFLVLVGPSGCGKSTMLRMLAGLEKPSRGTISFGDKTVSDGERGWTIEPAKRDTGLVFQSYALWPHMTVAGNVEWPLTVARMAAFERKARVTEVLSLLGIDALADRYPNEISGGQQQRVAIARMIAPKPKVLLFDEPLSNLDAKLRVQMRAEISALHNRLGVTTVYVTHDQIEAMTMADRVVLMRDGVIQQIASPDELFRSPTNLFAAGFIGSPGMNFVKAEIAGGRLSMLGTEIDIDRKRVDGRKNVIVGLRPEYMALGKTHEADFKIQPTLVESLGSEKYVYFQDPHHHASGGGDDDRSKGLIARISHSGVIAEDQELQLSFDPQNLSLFDPETEQAL